MSDMDKEEIKQQATPDGAEAASTQKSQENESPQANARGPGAIAPNERKPIEAVLHDCRRTFYFAFGLTALIDFLSIVSFNKLPFLSRISFASLLNSFHSNIPNPSIDSNLNSWSV